MSTFSTDEQFPKNRETDLMLSSSSPERLEKHIKELGKRIKVYTPVFVTKQIIGGVEHKLYTVQAQQVKDENHKEWGQRS